MAEDIIDVEPEAVESVERECTRHVQFIFDAKMVEFEVPWTYEELANLVTTVMADDGYLWVPQDEERGTGAYVNLKNCTNIKLFEREVPRPIEPPVDEPVEDVPELPAPEPEPEPEEDSPNRAEEFLDRMAEQYGIPLEGSVIHGRRDDLFIKALLRECLGMSEEDAEHAIAEFRERY